MNARVAGFDWDAGNSDKCRKHGVSLDEIEEVFRIDPFVLPDRTTRTEARFNAIGRNAVGRFVFVVFTLRNRDDAVRIRTISARYMHEKEVRAYETVRTTQAIPGLRER